MSDSDRLVCAMAREMARVPMVAVGLATTMPYVAAMVAKRAHRKDLKILSALGSVFIEEFLPARLPELELELVRAGTSTVDLRTAVEQLLPKEQPLEFLRPAQIDASGNTNDVRVGGRRLPGAAGIPDRTRYHGRIFYYVPRQRREVFVEKVDPVSGIGFPRPPKSGPGPRRVYTDLAMYDFNGGRMRLVAVHSGVTGAQIQETLGFKPAVAKPIKRIPPPTEAELDAIKRADTQRLRDLEALPRAELHARLREIFG